MKSLRTALRLFMEFADQQPQFGVSELAERTGMSKSHVSRALSAFVDAGLLVQDPKTRTFSVGLRAFMIGARFVNYHPLSSAAMPIMRELAQRTGHSTRLSVMEGDEAIYILGVEGPHFVDTGWRAGTTLPLHSTTGGRVLLAFIDSKRAEALIARMRLDRLTENTVTSRATLKRLVGRIHERGFDVQRGETTRGLGTVGVPVFGPDQQVLGVLSIAFPVHMVPAEAEPEYVELLHDAAKVLSMRMGSAVYPFGGSRSTVRRRNESLLA
jgi:DNA-binding IclR family transcriptional regulator